MRVIDSHVHFWRIGGPGQTWPDAGWPLIYRDFGPVELLAAISAGGPAGSVAAVRRPTRRAETEQASAVAAATAADVQGVVLVQSQPDDRDTDWILEVARDAMVVLAVVGWVDLASPAAPARIAELAGKPKLRGLRPMLQAIDDTEWILRRELEPALQAMVQHGLRFDALIQPRHLPVLLEFARRWPKLAIVVDHGAKPRIALGEIEPWQAQLAQLSLLPNIYCKLSGLRTEQTVGAPTAELQPYIRQLVASFPGRLMWGSDWPVLLHARDSYSDWLECARQYAGAQDQAQLDSLFSGAAQDFYGLR
ncbi:MAG TPA: amidohydrolase family protein [Steroidobacteraceae bacterium]|nr:amidohydrolase family protein [Steroidobacteraceae bacterium]